ncbi:armadillo repeat-containing protein 7-like [Ptychodera flava]|uniref:armadillo repeat-containing protein 7-like n=1 Tax=Ptychodera flava TaxID=63121 RepID=UPI003969D26C
MDRLEFLQQLVLEFSKESSDDTKEQVLANLANFAYDPANMEYLRQLNAVDLFLDMLDEQSEKLVEFGLGGLCNLAQYDKCKEQIISSDGIQLILSTLCSSNEEIVVAAITCLLYLISPNTKKDITTIPVIQSMQQFQLSSNSRISNLATIFLEDFCTSQEKQAASSTQQHAIGIPLPPSE